MPLKRGKTRLFLNGGEGGDSNYHSPNIIHTETNSSRFPTVVVLVNVNNNNIVQSTSPFRSLVSQAK